MENIKAWQAKLLARAEKMLEEQKQEKVEFDAVNINIGEEERKVVLVRDNAPENCKKCDFLVLFKGQYFCMADGGAYVMQDVVRYNMRPMDCPWKPLPNKVNVSPDGLSAGAYAFASACGWNGCIDEIEGREEREEKEKESEPEAQRVQLVGGKICLPGLQIGPGARIEFLSHMRYEIKLGRFGKHRADNFKGNDGGSKREGEGPRMNREDVRDIHIDKDNIYITTEDGYLEITRGGLRFYPADGQTVLIWDKEK